MSSKDTKELILAKVYSWRKHEGPAKETEPKLVAEVQLACVIVMEKPPRITIK